jgi:hypothetical protein
MTTGVVETATSVEATAAASKSSADPPEIFPVITSSAASCPSALTVPAQRLLAATRLLEHLYVLDAAVAPAPPGPTTRCIVGVPDNVLVVL